MGYENTTRDTEISTQQLSKECLILAKGKSLKCKTIALQDGRDSVDITWAEPVAVRPYETLWSWYMLFVCTDAVSIGKTLLLVKCK